MLLVLWALIAVGVWCLDRGKPSVRTTVEFLRQHPLTPSLSPQERKFWITDLAARLNNLASDDRQRLFLNPQMRQSLAQMTDQEKSLYLQLTLGRGVQEMLQGFDRAGLGQRLGWMDQALNDLEQLQRGSRQDLEKILDHDALVRIAQEGLTRYLRDADVTSQIQLQPFVERIQSILQLPR